MVKADLITGFLGSGKTTFIRKYAEYLIAKKINIGILENDLGAINVDMMLLKDLEGEYCELEMVAGGCDADCHKRRFKTKLIAMGMCGYERILIEPSGIYDTDEFFDTLYEEPICNWYRTGSVIVVVDAGLGMEEKLSKEAEYLLASQIYCSGLIVLSRAEHYTDAEIKNTIDYLNKIMAAQKTGRVLKDEEFLIKAWNNLEETDFERIMSAGKRQGTLGKQNTVEEGVFQTLFYMKHTVLPHRLSELAENIINDPNCGHVFRIKGFAEEQESGWKQLNAKKDCISVKDTSDGQQVLIVIGEHLNEQEIQMHIDRSEKISAGR